MSRVPALLLLLPLWLAACGGGPPEREMNQAQGAIDAARAAGAEQYAAAEYQAAVAALERSRAAVSVRDYRQALSQALDAKERGQDAARQAAGRRAIVRSEAERQLGDATTALHQARVRLKLAESSRVPPRDVAAARRTLDRSDSALQKARAALTGEDYIAARDGAAGVLQDIQTAREEIDASLVLRAARRRR